MQGVVEIAADELPEEGRPEFLAALRELEIWAPEVARVGFDVVAYEDMVTDMINQDRLHILRAAATGEPLAQSRKASQESRGLQGLQSC